MIAHRRRLTVANDPPLSVLMVRVQRIEHLLAVDPTTLVGSGVDPAPYLWPEPKAAVK